MASNAAVTNTVHSNTTFVQTDPSTFRAVVQKLTGAPTDSSSQKLPLTSGEKCPKRPAFRLHERRRSSKKLELDLNRNSPAGGIGSELSMVSPVSTLEFLARQSPATPMAQEGEKGSGETGFFCLHPSPITTPRGSGSDPPELLPLFPLHSPRDCFHDSCSSVS